MKDHDNLPAALYLVATPLGNLEDLTFRALRVLKSARWIAAEDTRVARKLLESQGISGAEIISLHEHSGPKKVEEVVAKLKNGESVAYFTDAGSPGISDPGSQLVAAAAAEGVAVVPVPGPSAPVALLSVAGFSATAFAFHGFFPRENGDRERLVSAWKSAGGVHVFFESPHRIREALKFLAQALPATPLVIGREMTKKFESFYRGTCAQLQERLGSEEPRGEYALALDVGEAPSEEGLPEAEAVALFGELAALGLSQKALVKVGQSHGLAKNRSYELALKALGKS